MECIFSQSIGLIIARANKGQLGVTLPTYLGDFMNLPKKSTLSSINSLTYFPPSPFLYRKNDGKEAHHT
jgi:hypothetical protein